VAISEAIVFRARFSSLRVVVSGGGLDLDGKILLARWCVFSRVRRHGGF
jgi:hypothetical protein